MLLLSREQFLKKCFIGVLLRQEHSLRWFARSVIIHESKECEIHKSCGEFHEWNEMVFLYLFIGQRAKNLTWGWSRGSDLQFFHLTKQFKLPPFRWGRVPHTAHGTKNAMDMIVTERRPHMKDHNSDNKMNTASDGDLCQALSWHAQLRVPKRWRLHKDYPFGEAIDSFSPETILAASREIETLVIKLSWGWKRFFPAYTLPWKDRMKFIRKTIRCIKDPRKRIRM